MSTFDRMKFGERLRNRRIGCGFERQQDLATAVGISVQSINYYELGKRLPDAETLYNLAACLECSSDWLLGITENRDPDNALIARKTGLSDSAIEALSENYTYFFAQRNLILCALIESGYLLNIVDALVSVLDFLEYEREVDESMKRYDTTTVTASRFDQLREEMQKWHFDKAAYQFAKDMEGLYEEMVASFSEKYGKLLLARKQEEIEHIECMHAFLTNKEP